MVRPVLQETPNVRQEPAGGRRRWFEDDVLPLELIVWYGAAEEIEGWQICYDFGGGEHALTWRPGSGFVHRAVDTGSSGPWSNPTPILVADGRVPWSEISRRFGECSASLEPALHAHITSRLDARN